MREITKHHTNAANRAITIQAGEPDPNNGNASHEYMIGTNPWTVDNPEDFTRTQHVWRLLFQHGPTAEVGVNGITNEVLLVIVADRLRGFQSGKYACDQNDHALNNVENALCWLEQRTRERERRGVEGTHEV